MNPEKIGQFIKEIRVKNNLTQKDLADKYNVTYQAVSKWENGKNLPDILLIR
jgi:transcriptional regulator with XRE-family HTH domain